MQYLETVFLGQPHVADHIWELTGDRSTLNHYIFMFYIKGLSPVLDAHLGGPHGHGTKPMVFWLLLNFCGNGLSNTTSYCDVPTAEKQAKREAMGSALIVSALPLKDGLVHGYSTASPQPCHPSHTCIRHFGLCMHVYMHNTRETLEKNFAQNIE